MATFTKLPLSSNTGGHNAPLDFASIPGTFTLHTTGTSTAVFDEVWVWINNPGTTVRNAILLVNGVYQYGQFEIPARTSILALAGHVVTGSGPSSATVDIQDPDLLLMPLYAYGFVNRIS